ncbi:YciI family protein [Paenarthrobacter sp. TYUT067]|uniref:YciI family protein n=1 Tax=Paenarthrobacter sp. TYUT067 TaxID=2926245 RepID=UPI00202DD148|nr:YciI family protein [Paenarthrobacter sp. TYUT067]MCM0618094.1 YciI family protein [Paenarthrobacter sp. TYUT067]
MFVVSLNYKVPDEIVDFHRPGHMAWLKDAFDGGIFLASGRRVPATGGVLLSKVDRATLDASLAKDPFYSNGVAEFEIIEFTATSVAEGYENLLDS